MKEEEVVVPVTILKIRFQRIGRNTSNTRYKNDYNSNQNPIWML